MIHARGRARSRKINYISKVKIEFGWWGAFVFARRRSSSLSPSATPYSRNGRNFKRKFTNEGDFPRTPPRRFPDQEEDEMKEQQGGEEVTKRKIARRFSVFRASSSTHSSRLSRSFVSFFLISSTRTCGYNEPWPRKMRYRDPGKNLPSHTPRS